MKFSQCFFQLLLVLLSVWAITGIYSNDFDEEIFLRQGELQDWLLTVVVDGEPPSEENNELENFIVSWNEALAIVISHNVSNIQTSFPSTQTSSESFTFESIISQANETVQSALTNLTNDDSSDWDFLQGAVSNDTNFDLDILSIEAREYSTEQETEDDDDDDDDFGTAEIVGVVFAALLLYYCIFLICATIFYICKAIVKKIKSRSKEGDSSEEGSGEEMEDVKDDDEEDEGTESSGDDEEKGKGSTSNNKGSSSAKGSSEESSPGDSSSGDSSSGSSGSSSGSSSDDSS